MRPLLNTVLEHCKPCFAIWGFRFGGTDDTAQNTVLESCKQVLNPCSHTAMKRASRARTDIKFQSALAARAKYCLPPDIELVLPREGAPKRSVALLLALVSLSLELYI